MAPQHYDVLDPERPGHFAERHWLPRNTPVFDALGQLSYIIHSSVNVTEEVQARRALAQAQDREHAARQEAERERQQLSQLALQAPAAICLLQGPAFVFELVNPGFQQLFAGRPLLGQPLLKAVPEWQASAIWERLQAVYHTGQAYHDQQVPLVRRPASGPEVGYFNLTFQARFNARQQVEGVYVFAFEVTEQVQASQLVRATIDSSKALIQVFEAVRDEAGRLVDFRWTLVNEQAAAQYGTDVVGQQLRVLNPGVVEAGIFDQFVQVVESGQPQFNEHEYRQEQYNGWFEQSVVRLGDGLVTTTTDITARKQAEEALRHSEERFRAIVTQATVGIAETQDGRFTYVNDRYCEITGYSREELVGKLVGDITHPEEATRDLNLLRRLYATGEPFVVDKRYVRPDGSVRWSLTSVTPIRDAQGRITRGCAACIDVTDRRQAEQAVQVANERLVRINGELDTFVYTASHDLKSPITNIEGIMLALREQLPPAAQHEEIIGHLLALMDGAVARFQQTLGHLTDISRLGHDQLSDDGEAEVVDLPALIEAVRLDILPELTAAGATLTVAVNQCPTFRFSAKNLRSILYNLLSTAVKYRAPDRAPEVVLHCRPAAGRLVLEVQDNGLGLSKTQQGRLFGLFRRLHTHVEGSGVGLYMVKKIVENARGTIAVHSEAGVGTTFIVTLPADASQPPAVGA
jgi:PAS domain S-box-containing protein